MRFASSSFCIKLIHFAPDGHTKGRVSRRDASDNAPVEHSVRCKGDTAVNQGARRIVAIGVICVALACASQLWASHREPVWDQPFSCSNDGCLGNSVCYGEYYERDACTVICHQNGTEAGRAICRSVSTQ